MTETDFIRVPVEYTSLYSSEMMKKVGVGYEWLVVREVVVGDYSWVTLVSWSRVNDNTLIFVSSKLV
jgi:hypothetical protein